MRQSQVQVSEEENDVKVEEHAIPPVARKRGRPSGKRKMFSNGFRERLEKHLKKIAHVPNLTPKFYSEGLNEVCELDYSQLNQEQTEDVARVTFELYYTDKTVQQLTFEKNCVKIVAGYCMK